MPTADALSAPLKWLVKVRAVGSHIPHNATLARPLQRFSLCHVGFNFTDEQFHNTGVGLYNPDPDLGRYALTHRDEDTAAFKTPTLRDLAQTAPYMHDGSLTKLENVVRFYNRGGIKNPYLANELKPLHLTPQEQADLLAFLTSLTGTWVNAPAPTPPQ